MKNLAMNKQQINSNNAPAAIGPYSQAIRCGDLIFCSGQLPLDPAGELLRGSIEEQTHRIFQNIKEILNAAGCELDDIIKTTIYLTNLSNFKVVNEIYATYFNAPFPARATIGVASLPLNAEVEIEAIAKVKD